MSKAAEIRKYVHASYQFELLKRALQYHLGLYKRKETKCFCDKYPIGDINYYVSSAVLVHFMLLWQNTRGWVTYREVYLVHDSGAWRIWTAWHQCPGKDLLAASQHDVEAEKELTAWRRSYVQARKQERFREDARLIYNSWQNSKSENTLLQDSIHPFMRVASLWAHYPLGGPIS